MAEERKQINPAIQQEINDVKKLISEKNMMYKFKEDFEIKIKRSEEFKRAMEILQKQFDFEITSYEDAFRAVGGPQFADENRNEELDTILKKIAKSTAEKLLSPEEKKEFLESFLDIYRTMLKS